MYFCVLLSDWAKEGKFVRLDASIVDMGDKSFTVLVHACGLEARLHLDNHLVCKSSSISFEQVCWSALD